MTNDLYSFLKVKRNCTSDELLEAWKKIVSTNSQGSAQYLLAKSAYDTLIDPVKREIYNRFQVTETSIEPVDNDFNFSSTFLENKDVQQIVGNLKSNANQSIRVVRLPLADFYLGKTVPVTFKNSIPCNQCHLYTKIAPCPKCILPTGGVLLRVSCVVCKNTRRIRVSDNCRCCNNKKVITQDTVTAVTIKPGALDGQKLRCANSITEVVLRQQPHHAFNRRGCDLYFRKRINLTEALCGVRFVVDHLDGRKLLLSSSSGEVLYPGCRKVVPKEGMPLLDSKSGRRGNLIVIFEVCTPNTLQESVAKEIEKFMPLRPKFQMPSNPETEEYTLVDFDPKFKLNAVPDYSDPYIDDTHDSNHNLFKPKEQCLHQ